ncbi:hypothetical protein FGO68_gene12696 [Halteria grandinella]|uniref:Uncharacterized protein n=1 Tax=Halteria grandinella TaxID=5974 RepID=A0A8J8NSU4_HALGN|nr:hypothetical protein FGO68_gene12696 [Halteria grandinella]
MALQQQILLPSFSNHRGLPCFEFGIQEYEKIDEIYSKWHSIDKNEQTINEIGVSHGKYQQDLDIDSSEEMKQEVTLEKPAFVRKPKQHFNTNCTPSTQGSSGFEQNTSLLNNIKYSQDQKGQIRQEQQLSFSKKQESRFLPPQSPSIGGDTTGQQNGSFNFKEYIKAFVAEVQTIGNYKLQNSQISQNPNPDRHNPIQSSSSVKVHSSISPMNNNSKQKSQEKEESKSISNSVGVMGSSMGQSFQGSVKSSTYQQSTIPMDASSTSKLSDHSHDISEIETILDNELSKKQFIELHKGTINLETLGILVGVVTKHIEHFKFYLLKNNAEYNKAKGLILNQQLLITQGINEFQEIDAQDGLDQLKQLKPTFLKTNVCIFKHD